MALTMCIHVQRYRSTDTELYQPMSEAAHSSVTCNSLHQVKQSYKQNPSNTSSCNYSDVPMCAGNTMQCAGPTAVKPLHAAAAGNSSDRETDTVLLHRPAAYNVSSVNIQMHWPHVVPAYQDITCQSSRLVKCQIRQQRHRRQAPGSFCLSTEQIRRRGRHAEPAMQACTHTYHVDHTHRTLTRLL